MATDTVEEAQHGVTGNDGIEVRWIMPEGDAGVNESPRGEVSSRVDVPRDYKLLVPREWFRIDLMQEGWRTQLKTLSFSAPLMGLSGPMERMCEAMAGSLRWVL
ncbi:hypothetical protein [Streptomyces sp. NPDC056948]|uniref:hypothetical protein n=1 Tax=Streptomyces sp. NPDC056948 TaxID=3345975 RepID=UPI0036335DB4